MSRALGLSSAISVAALLLCRPVTAFAADGDSDDEGPVPKNFPRLVMDSGRPEIAPPDPDAYRFMIHGEYQMRLQGQRSFPLSATASAINSQPGLIENSLGQNFSANHWIRVTPRFQIRDS